ncbi:Copper transporter 6 [Striga hermonthica]|uniref:Copper transport protein n=1 Tax=Striga hermonthica TaxID=68872 RepID=A0A9N7N9Y1_STRHE|nr:Copper transporter 6 [Striga hermonthica]CAA0829824.1 Copper transporter 6 [Striga hermonthica]
MPMNMTKTMNMHTSFFWGKHVTILFDGWPGCLGMYVLALMAVLLLAATVEMLPAAAVSKQRGKAAAAVSGAVHGLRMCLAYLVMLSVMSFNVGVFAAAVAGHAAGRLVVRYRELTAVGHTVDF